MLSIVDFKRLEDQSEKKPNKPDEKLKVTGVDLATGPDMVGMWNIVSGMTTHIKR